MSRALPRGYEVHNSQLWPFGELTAADTIVLKIEEVEGVATKVIPVPLSEDNVLRMQHWLASHTTPRLDAESRAVASATDPLQGVYVIDAPRTRTSDLQSWK